MAAAVRSWQHWQLLRAARSYVFHPRPGNVWIQRSQSACWSPEYFVPLVTSTGRQSRTFSPLFALREGARLELAHTELIFMQVECFTGLEEGKEPELRLLIQILAWSQLLLPQLSSLLLQRTSYTRLIHRRDGCCGHAAVLGLSTKPHGKECAASCQITVFPWESRRRNIVCWQKCLLLFLAILSFLGKCLAAFEWKTAQHLKTADQSWQHMCTPHSAPVGTLLDHWVGVESEGWWDRRLTQSAVGKLHLEKHQCLKKQTNKNHPKPISP